MAQSAVEWLRKNLKDFPHIKHSQHFKDLIEQAKQMEKEQIMDAFIAGGKSGFNSARGSDFKTFEDYCKETYKKE